MKKEISTNNAPAAVGPYSQAIEANGFLFLSGQLPIDPKIGKIIKGGIKEQTEQSFKNIEAILKEAGLSLENIVKVSVFLNDINNFAAVNEIYQTKFSTPYPARSAYAVKDMPMGAMVEIEVIAVK